MAKILEGSRAGGLLGCKALKVWAFSNKIKRLIKKGKKSNDN